VNGNVAIQGQKLNSGDCLQVDDCVKDWENCTKQSTRVFLYHKAFREEVTANALIFSKLAKLEAARWIPVWPPSINTSGLVLITNDGELSNQLTHLSTQIEREYAVRVFGDINDATLDRLKQGVEFEGGKAKFDEIHFTSGESVNKWYRIVISEYRRGLVRSLLESQHVMISKIKLIRYGTVNLPDGLEEFHYCELNYDDLKSFSDFISSKKD